MKKYAIPRYVEEEKILCGGSWKQWGGWLPFLFIGILLFCFLSGKIKIVVPCFVIGSGYVLTMMKIDRETNLERLLLEVSDLSRPRSIFWEREKENE